MGISVKTIGSWKRTERMLRLTNIDRDYNMLRRYGADAIERLKQATPKDTGLTANSWSFEVSKTKTGYSLQFFNSNVTRDGVPIVVLLQTGHGTKNGGYVAGVDFINPALKPIFEKIANEAYKVVTK